MRVLVADDDPTYRNLLRDMLTKWHFEVALANDGMEALTVMRRNDAPRLVILDWEMPEVDGFEVARTLRATETTDGVYILMITGRVMNDSVNTATDPPDPSALQVLGQKLGGVSGLCCLHGHEMAVLRGSDLIETIPVWFVCCFSHVSNLTISLLVCNNSSIYKVQN